MSVYTYLLFIFSKIIYLRERESEGEWGKGQRENPQAYSPLGSEPHTGLVAGPGLTTHEITTQAIPRVRHLTS